jgi:PAS domain S-box-containing protein
MPLIAVAVALPYVDRRELMWLMAVAWVECVVISMLSTGGTPLGLAPAWFTATRRAIGAAVTSGSVLILGWQFKVRSEHLRDALRNREESANAARTRYRELFDGNPVGLFRVTATGTILDANHALLRTLGAEEEAGLLGRRAPWLSQELLDSALTAEFYGRDVQTTRADGTPVWLRLSLRTVRTKPEALLEGSAEDVTEQHATQDRLLQAVKLETVGRLAGGVAHDFNNLLTAIRGYAELLSADLRDDPERLESVSQIARATDRASLLTAQLLAVGRRQMLQPAPIDLRDLLEELRPTLGQVVGRGVNLLIHCAPGAGQVSADPAQFEQVLLNLAANARDAMPDGGTLTIATADVDLEVADGEIPAGAWVTIAVRDTGTGMDEATRRRAFDPFFTTKPVGRGTGMGLASVYGIVVQHGGHLTLDTSPGRGSTFTIHLPRVHAASRAAATTAPVLLPPPAAIAVDTATSSVPTQPTILLAEDDRQLRGLMERILTRHGYRVLTAARGDEALAISDADLTRVELLVTDVVMPGADGPTVALALEARRPGLRTLFVSGYAESFVLQQGLRPGAAFLAKPYTPEVLLARIQDQLGDRADAAA